MTERRFKEAPIPKFKSYFGLEPPKSPPLSMEEVGFFGRLLSSFADKPEGKQQILDRFGITGVLRDPIGAGRADVFDAPTFSEGLSRLGGKVSEGAKDLADLAGDVPPAVGAGMGTAAGLAAGHPFLGGALGGALGETGTQSIGRLLGSTEKPNFLRTLGEGVLGGLGALVPSPAIKASAPFAKEASTANIKQNVVEPAARFGVKSLPADALSESDFVTGAAARAMSAPTPHGDVVRAGRNQLRGEQLGAFEDIAKSAGAVSNAPRPGSDLFQSAVDATRQQRLDVVGQAFEKFKASVPDASTIPIVTTNSQAALDRMAARTKVSTLPDANITKGARSQIESFRKDIAGLRNFEQLDAFRQRVGDLLKSRPQMEELEKSGADRELLDLYGSLKQDLFDSLDEGLLARTFGGQTAGQISPVRDVHGVRVADLDAGRANVSRMEQGLMGERDLPGFPGRKEPPIGGQRTSGEMLDETAVIADEAKALKEAANAQMVDLFNTERSTILRMMRDPGQAENVYHRLFRRGGSAENIKSFQQHIGATPTPGGLPASAEGEAAWTQLRNQLFRDLRESGQDALAERLPRDVVPLDGKKLIEGLDSLGGEELLSEALGRDTASRLYDFAHFLVNSNPSQRPFSTVSADAGKRTKATFFVISLARKIWEDMVDAGLRRTAFPAQGQMATFLTGGMAPTLQKQGTMRAIGAAAMTPLGRVDTGPNAANR